MPTKTMPVALAYPDSSLLSIHDIIAQHARERLFTHPLEWTKRQLSLLCCSFRPPRTTANGSSGPVFQASNSNTIPVSNMSAPSNNRSPPNSDSSSDEPSDDSSNASSTASSPSSNHSAEPCSEIGLSSEDRMIFNLVTKGCANEREQGLLILLEEGENCFPYIARNIHLRVGRVRCSLTGHVLGDPRAAASEPQRHCPSIVCVDQSTLTAARDKLYAPPLGVRPNLPVRRLQWLRRQQHLTTAADPFRDPYIAAILIALAQSQQAWIRSSLGRGVPPQSCTVHVLFTSSLDRDNLHVYTATVSESFLEKLADTTAAPKLPARLDIASTTVPYRPFATFCLRLVELVSPRGTKRRRDGAL